VFNAQNLLGALMDSAAPKSTRGRMQHAMGDQGLGGQQGLLDQLMGGQSAQRPASGGGGDLLGSLSSMAGSLMGGSQGSGGRSNAVGLGGLGALAGALVGGGGDSLKGALGGGALALLGSLAYDALRNRSENQAPAASGFDPGNLPLGMREPMNRFEEDQLQDKAILVLKAMINAAKSDGTIDRTEMERIVGKLQEQGADPEAQAFVREQMNGPMDTAGLVAAVRDPQTAAEVYAASLLAIEVDTQAELQYLQQLAQQLGISSEVAKRIHAALGIA